MDNRPPIAYYILIGLYETGMAVHHDLMGAWGRWKPRYDDYSRSTEEITIENFKRIADIDREMLITGLDEFREFTNLNNVIERVGE